MFMQVTHSFPKGGMRKGTGICLTGPHPNPSPKMGWERLTGGKPLTSLPSLRRGEGLGVGSICKRIDASARRKQSV